MFFFCSTITIQVTFFIRSTFISKYSKVSPFFLCIVSINKIKKKRLHLLPPLCDRIFMNIKIFKSKSHRNHKDCRTGTAGDHFQVVGLQNLAKTNKH